MFGQKRDGDPEETGFTSRFPESYFTTEAPTGVSGRHPQSGVQGGKDGRTFSPLRTDPQEGEWQYFAIICWDHQKPNPRGGWGLATGGKEKGKEVKGENKCGRSTEESTKKALRRSLPAWPCDTIKVSTRDGQSYAEILEVIKAKVNPMDAELGARTIRRSRKEEVLLFPKKGAAVSAFEKALGQVVGEMDNVRALASKVIAAFCLQLGRHDFDEPYWFYKRVGSVQTAGVPLVKSNALRLLQLGKLMSHAGACRPCPKSYRCQVCEAPPRCLTCVDRSGKDVAYVPGSGYYPVFRD